MMETHETTCVAPSSTTSNLQRSQNAEGNEKKRKRAETGEEDGYGRARNEKKKLSPKQKRRRNRCRPIAISAGPGVLNSQLSCERNMDERRFNSAAMVSQGNSHLSLLSCRHHHCYTS